MSQTEVPDIGTREESAGRYAGHGPGERKSFWSSMPGMLTALGGLVTAVGTVAAFYFGAGGGGGDGGSSSGNGGGYVSPVPDPGPQVEVYVLPQPPAPAPGNVSLSGSSATRTGGIVSGEDTDSFSFEAQEVIEEWGSGLDAGTAAVAEGCGMGYADDCEELLDTLVYECYDGSAVSCDVLFLASPEGTAEEEYGNSCGGRVSDNSSWCRDLVSS
jgi:hypothetical protein